MLRALWMIGVAAVLVVLVALGGSAATAQGNPTPTHPSAICGRTLSNVARWMERDFYFVPKAQPGDANYCAALEEEINLVIEATLRPPVGISGQSREAFAFVDFGARQFVGAMPIGIDFLAVARNALPGSQMILVRGDGFAVFVDYTFTTLSAEDFSRLPDYREYEGDLTTFCTAPWCKDPEPRPR